MATALSYKGTDSTTNELDRIEHIYNGAGEDIAYTYDTLGMVNSLDRTGMEALLPAISNAVYDPANRMVRFNGITINYDANGNPLRLNGMDLTWNQKGQLTNVSGAAAGPIEYKYDAMGRRVQKIVNSVTTNYLYDGFNLIAELDGDNNNAAIAWYIYAGLDRPLARVDATDGSVLYYHQDLLGSVIALTDSTGAVTTRYNYSPFGETEVTHLIGQVDQPFQFTGREWDAETGLYFYRARYYSPDMRRFISEDPIRFAGGDVNFYAYVGNNPVNFRDPEGLFASDFHESETRLAGAKAGCSSILRSHIAAANRDTDEVFEIKKTFYNPLSKYHFTKKAEARDAVMSAIRRGDAYAFGQSLHRYQDYFSHTKQGVTYLNHEARHLITGISPDNLCPAEDVEEMRKDTQFLLELYCSQWE